MGTLLTEKLVYMASIESMDAGAAALGRIPEKTALLLGEYGPIDPLAAVNRVRESFDGAVLLEIIARNKNRNSIKSAILTAASCGFDGVLLASGVFSAGGGTAKPVYDLDPPQMLKLALGLRTRGIVPESFVIAVRSASGSGPAELRARWYIEEGADYIALEKGSIPGLEPKTLLVEPVTQA